MIEQIKTHILYWLKKQNMQDIALLIEQGVQSEEVLNSFEKSVLKSIPEYKEFTLKTKFDLNLSEHQLFQDVLLQRALGTNPEKQLIYHFLNAMVNEPKTTPNGCNGGKDKLVIKKSQAYNEELSSKNCYSFMDCFKKRQSFIDQHFTSFAFNLPCNNEEFILFEDFTDNHNKATVGAFSFNNLPCVATLVVETRNGRRIERELRPAQNAILFDTTLFVEDLRRVIIRCSGDPTGSCSGFISVAKTFCISCSNKFSKV